jgi:hypothetical protein
VVLATVATSGQYSSVVEMPVDREVRTLDGKDITDRVFDLQTDAMTLVAMARIGRHRWPARSRTSEAPEHERTRPGVSSRSTPLVRYGSNLAPRTSAPAIAWALPFSNPPPGDYYMVAIDGATADGWTDPKTLEALARQATKVTVIGSNRPRLISR